MKQLAALFVFSVLFLGSVGAQNLKDDMVKSDLDALKAKVALLAPNFKDFPYLAYYLAKTNSYAPAMVEYLIEQGADIEQVDDNGVGPLYYALARNNVDAVRILLAHKVNVNAGWKSGQVDFPHYFDPLTNTFPASPFGGGTLEAEGKWTPEASLVTIRPLWVAFSSSQAEEVPLLLAAGADPLGLVYQFKDAKASTTKKAVIRTNTVFDQVVAKFSTSDNSLERVSPVVFANGVRIWRAVRALPVASQPQVAPSLAANLFAYFALGNLKDFKAGLVTTGENTLRFLPYAALADSWDIIDLILKYNQLTVNDVWSEGQTLLQWAIGDGQTGVARLLLDHGATLPTKVSSRHFDAPVAPLVAAAEGGDVELVKLLLEHGEDANDGFPLAFANHSPEIRQALIDAGAKSVGLANFHGRGFTVAGTLLFHAADEAIPEAVSFWLARGISPNADPDKEGVPLVAAALRGSVESVRLLLASGADPKVLVTASQASYFGLWSGQTRPLRDVIAGQVTETSDNPIQRARMASILRLLDAAPGANKAP